MPKLVSRIGTEFPIEFKEDKPYCTIGRNGDNNIRLREHRDEKGEYESSRYHAAIYADFNDPSILRIINYSARGTTVNDEDLAQSQVELTDQIERRRSVVSSLWDAKKRPKRPGKIGEITHILDMIKDQEDCLENVSVALQDGDRINFGGREAMNFTYRV